MSASIDATSRVEAFDIVVIGGGGAGITVAAEMRRHRKTLSIATLERSDIHAYQPGWTLAGAVMLADGRRLTYGSLVVYPGLQLDRDRIDGLKDALHTLESADGPARQASLTVTGPDGRGDEVVRASDMLHVNPPQSAPEFLKKSPLADEAGWIWVDPASPQQARFPAVFGLGDAAGTTNAKTAAAVRPQAPVVLRNLLATLDGARPSAVYGGYGSCPLITGYGGVILAAFGYGGKITPGFPLDPRGPRFGAWLLKQSFLPYLYCNWMLKGSELDVKHRERPSEDAA